jgi:hypothetical protein
VPHDTDNELAAGRSHPGGNGPRSGRAGPEQAADSATSPPAGAGPHFQPGDPVEVQAAFFSLGAAALALSTWGSRQR